MLGSLGCRLHGYNAEKRGVGRLFVKSVDERLGIKLKQTPSPTPKDVTVEAMKARKTRDGNLAPIFRSRRVAGPCTTRIKLCAMKALELEALIWDLILKDTLQERL